MAATRPGFLLASVVPVLLGLGAAAHAVSLSVGGALVSLAGALCAHAGINVLNDVFDHDAGCDEHNDERVFPFTGGSRIIQNAVLTPAQMTVLGYGLMTATALMGLYLSRTGGPVLVPIGLAGLVIGWAYSAPPLRLSARGLGELCVGVGFGLLIPLGVAAVQTSKPSGLALCAGLSYGFLITAVLFINQVPDFRADRDSGKRNLLVRLGRERAWRVYAALAAAAYLSLLVLVGLELLPPACLLGLLTLPLHVGATRGLRRWATTPGRLLQPIRFTLLGATGHGFVLALALALTR